MTILKERESTATTATSPAIASTEVHPKKPSRLRRAGKAIARHPKLTQFFILLTLASGTTLFLLYLLFRGAWSTHQENLPVLRAIWLMETKRESTWAMNESPQRVVTRSYDTLEEYVEKDDWTWVNRFGATITYSKQDKRMIASCRPYSPLYLTCNLSELP
ncbi:MAG: hypothetical protein AAFY72_18140 [Cyanobacteria bacterium J06649_4]